MAHYAIGDLQGCYDELMALLRLIDFNHGKDTLWLTGDLVNRGPKSWECLQFVRQHESSVQTVLGNHDLHLLAVAYGFGKLKKNDTLAPVLNHDKWLKMRDWLCQQPLLRQQHYDVLVHAGLLPEWSVTQAADLAAEVSHVLQTRPHDFFREMYGNLPDRWSDDLQGAERWRVICNVLTRMRVLTLDGALDLNFKGTYEHMPPDKMAWFDAPNRQHLSHTIVFGHWSALGLYQHNRVLALDTGALWGGQLTAANLHTREIVQVQSQNYADWRKVGHAS